MRLLAATTNRGKVRELAEALARLGFEVLDLHGAGTGDVPAPDETGTTFEENALLKARYYHGRTGLAVVADDSGLEVDALGGRPGLASARYSDTDATRVAKLLGELEGVPPAGRAARFVCALALVGEGLCETFTGTCQGRIVLAPAGANGFGFDPVFAPDGEYRTFAEMAPEEKAAVSHRGRALSALAEFVRGR
jgi:non-canonical purine NTP pyrophosphatase (RdgB/HAM1 family)